MWAPDMVLDLMQPVISIMTTLDRLTEEFIIWSSSEFDYLDLSDSTSRTSVIMPQKKNPYGLAYIRGQARSLTGVFMSLINTNQTISGQPDNRIFAYSEVPKSLDYTYHCIKLFNDVLTQSTFNKDKLAAAAGEGFTYSTDICDYLVLKSDLDNRTVHKVVGKAVRQCIEQNQETLFMQLL
jgi:argininosuccinate lyase